MSLSTIFVAIALTLASSAQHRSMPAGMSHEEHLKQMQKDDALKKRGADAMGFDQDATVHHFHLLATGGSIENDQQIQEVTAGPAIASLACREQPPFIQGNITGGFK
jgi:hypothetical protein